MRERSQRVDDQSVSTDPDSICSSCCAPAAKPIQFKVEHLLKLFSRIKGSANRVAISRDCAMVEDEDLIQRMSFCRRLAPIAQKRSPGPLSGIGWNKDERHAAATLPKLRC